MKGEKACGEAAGARTAHALPLPRLPARTPFVLRTWRSAATTAFPAHLCALRALRTAAPHLPTCAAASYTRMRARTHATLRAPPLPTTFHFPFACTTTTTPTSARAFRLPASACIHCAHLSRATLLRVLSACCCCWFAQPLSCTCAALCTGLAIYLLFCLLSRCACPAARAFSAFLYTPFRYFALSVNGGTGGRT